MASSELTTAQFARALYQGLGRPIRYAHAHSTAPFADVILHACLYNPLYDWQTDVGRAAYLYELIAATDDPALFRAPILAALADPDEAMDEELLFDLALRFAQEGDSGARAAVVARFLDNVSSGKTTGADQLAALDGSLGLRFVVEQIGAALLRAVDFSDSWLPWLLLDDLERAFAAKAAVLHDPRVAAFRLAVRGSPDEQRADDEEAAQRRKLRDKLASLTYGELRAAVAAKQLSLKSVMRWAQQAPASELRLAADDLLAETRPWLLQRLLVIFSERELPNGYAPFLPLLNHADPLIVLRASLALGRFRHPELRARALTLIGHADTFEVGLILLVGNHEPGDYARLAALAQEQTDDEALHALGWRVYELLARSPSPDAAALLLTLYERGPCAQCRLKVVQELTAINTLPTALAEECRFDANENVRAFVAAAR